ncbi:MAG TPA: c-type cytochrome [Verrucomicrobiae bacterium]|nr:c-type cytochrome [Verrucomicrobiae bacterium]
MRNQPETVHEYNIPRLHWWFLITGFVFVVSLVLMIWVDYSGGYISWLHLRGDRTWKNYQRKFYTIEKQRLAEDAKAAEAKANEAGLGKLQDQLKKTRDELASKKTEEARLQAEVDQKRVADAEITRTFTMQKAVRDQYRSSYEETLERNNMNMQAPEVQEWTIKTDTQNGYVSKLDLMKQTADAKLQDAQDRLTALIGHEEDLQRSIKHFEDNIGLVTKRLNQLTSPLVQDVVNAPVLEFAASTYKVEQIVADTHHVDVNFATVPRVDRCTTCHKAIDRKDPTPDDLTFRAKYKIGAVEWSKLPEPLRNHPNLDLFLGDNSPHPMSKYGCTTCHWGWDRETTFSRTGHTPDAEEKQPYTYDSSQKLWVKYEKPSDDDDDDAKVQKAALEKPQIVEMTQREAWQKNYHWEEQEFLLQPMREAKYVQASCLKCHSDQTNLKGGEQLDHGRRLIEQLGCWSCHKMKQLETYTTHHVVAGEDFDSICKFYDVNPDDVRRVNGFPQDVSLTLGQDITIPIRTLRKPGPSLFKLASKTNKEWVRKWLANPVAFRPNTYMPRFWGLSNNEGTPDRNAVEMNAIAEFLFAVSDQPQYPAPPVQGNPENGKKLVSQVGCLACHVIDDKLMEIKPPATLKQYMDVWQYRRLRSQGPQLAGIGSKADVNWIYAWIKNPKQYNPRTKMPNLRLSDQEAADIASYLATLRKEKTDQETVPDVRPDHLDNETVEYLKITLPDAEAQQKINDLNDLIEMYFVDEPTMAYYQDPARMARDEARLADLQKQYQDTFDDAIDRQARKLAASIDQVKAKMAAAKQRVATMSPTEKKNVYLGSRLISRYGCYACHDIHGFENAKPIGTELSEWGSKPVDKLDFGLLDIEKDRLVWLKQKLHDPRSFDSGRIDLNTSPKQFITRSPQELLKMPKFNVTDDQIDQIVTVISGMTDEKLTPNEARQLTPAEFQMERGRWMAKELNCEGCHILEAQGGAIRATGIAQGMEPPMLIGAPTQVHEGQRVQPDWLFHFIKDPQTGEIRPWLHVRMPTFGLTDGDANVLVKYFAEEGRTEFPYQTPKIDTSPEHLDAGKQLFTQLKCALCHIVNGQALGKPLAEIPDEDLPRLAPNLSLAHARLQRDWLVNKWLVEPLAQMPGTRMPQFEYGTAIAPNVLGGDGRKQIEALVDYVLMLGANEQVAQAAPPPPSPAPTPAATAPSASPTPTGQP